MTKSDVREFLEKAWEKDYISDEDFDSFNDGDFGINKYPGSAEEWWAKNRSKLRDVQGWIKFNKDYKKNRSFEDQIQDYIGDVDIEELGDGDIQDIADDFEVDVDRVKEGIEQLQIREMKKQLDRADKENYGEFDEKGKQTSKSNKQISVEQRRAEKVKEKPKTFNWMNDYTTRRYIEGASMPELYANEAASKIGGLADFIPPQTPYVGQFAWLLNPTVKTVQRRIYDDNPVMEDVARGAADLGGNYLAGKYFGGKLGKSGEKVTGKAVGDVAAELAGTTGRVGKAAGDMFENSKIAKKIPETVKTSLVTGITRKGLKPDVSELFSDKTKNVIEDTDKQFESAVAKTMKDYEKDWEKGYYKPEPTDSDVLKEAYRRWNEKTAQE